MRINRLVCLPKFRIISIEHKNGKIMIFASVKSKRSQCPICGHFSTTVHDYYHRKLSDLPAFQNTTTLDLMTRKFKCKNLKCDRKVFSEQTSHINRYSRKTLRASKVLDSLSIELTGKLGSTLSKQLFLPVSTSTITRIAHKQQLPEIKQPVVLGIDDWAFRKGISYGTVLVDMETSTPIELLQSRDSGDLKLFLQKYPLVKIVTRDRASSYSSAVDEVCPDAIQVADRFHLLVNLSDALDKYFKSSRSLVKATIQKKTEEMSRVDKNISIETTADDPKTDDSNSVMEVQDFERVNFDQRIEKFNKVKELQKDNVGIKKIAKIVGITRITVRSYFVQDTLSPRNSSRSTNIDSYSKLIQLRLSTEGYKVKDILEEIISQGFDGGRTQAYYHINRIKTLCHKAGKNAKELQQTPILFIKPLSTRKLAKFIDVNIKDISDTDERSYMRMLIENISDFRVVRRLVQIFKRMLKNGCGNIKRWIEYIRGSKIALAGLKNFANGLLRDIKAVENAIHLPWSNGPVEGHVNRIKSIKRQMYGRASFELLRRKIILSQHG